MKEYLRFRVKGSRFTIKGLWLKVHDYGIRKN